LIRGLITEIFIERNVKIEKLIPTTTRQNDANTRERYDPLSSVYLGADNFIERDNLDETTRVKVTMLLIIATDFTLG